VKTIQPADSMLTISKRSVLFCNAYSCRAWNIKACRPRSGCATRAQTRNN